MDSKNLQRGTQLFELGRFKEAMSYFKDAISEDPHDWTSKFYLAICYFNEGDYKMASELTDSLLSETPDEPDIFYLKAKIALHQDKNKEALEFVEMAISKYPFNADYFGLKSGILLQQKKYKEALEVVNEGLRLDAKSGYCLNLRAQILTKLDRVDEADATVEDILHDNPEDAFSHANVGWVALENGNTKAALTHFKQALQFDPNMEYAREGMSTALKSKNFFYKWYLKYAFWIGKQSSRNQWIFIIGIYLLYRFSLNLLSDNGLTYIAIPLMVAYIFFALGGWIMEPLSNTILNFDRYGKYLLGRDQKLSGYTFGGLAILGLAAILLFYVLDIDYLLVLAITFISTLLPLSRAFLAGSKQGRIFGFAYGGLMLAIGILGPMFIDPFTAGLVVFIMMILYTWIGNFFQ